MQAINSLETIRPDKTDAVRIAAQETARASFLCRLRNKAVMLWMKPIAHDPFNAAITAYNYFTHNSPLHRYGLSIRSPYTGIR